MYRTIEDFLSAWKHEAASTERLLGVITQASLRQTMGPKYRDLARLAWHITQTLPEMMGRTGLKITGADEHAPVPATIEEIRTAYTQASRSLTEQIRASWTDATLLVEDDMYGSKWKRGLTLQSLVTHQAHHRGQMTVLMRQAGLAVPGVYGPSLEEWASMGMNPPPV